MAPQKPTSRSKLLSSYIFSGANTKIQKSKSKTQDTSKSGLKYRNGLLNASIPVRSSLMSIAKRNSNVSPLLRLPGEIRNKIWMYTLGYHNVNIGLRSCKRSWPIGHTLDVRPLHPASRFPRIFLRPTFHLPEVCRQIYVESAAFTYTLNTFSFDSRKTFDRWVKARPLGQRELVTSVNVPYDYMHVYRHGFRRTFCEKFPNIARIGVDEHIPFFERRYGEKDVILAKQRTVAFIHEKEGKRLVVEWHYGVAGAIVRC
ncbi:hypothetical protein CC86DRAFT_402107 [Ophiobolus disseminans]|uniref:Uncharacterized protein n=1 Tax=Ophiobolus disseminans TaxID=1469910 RepID=A0A6A7AEE4_9PLEO|nr:hypothetical protein CC86DRAFT_402107 [Ophiobolus disseminans]